MQTLYLAARQYGSNFEMLEHGCNNCNIAGWLLATNSPISYGIQLHTETNEIINNAIEAICNGNRTACAKARKQLKHHSLHPVPVWISLLLSLTHYQQNGFDAVKEYFNPHFSWLYDFNHILIEGIGNDILENLELLIMQEFQRHAVEIKGKIDLYYKKQSKFTLPGQQRFPNGIFDIKHNQWKTIISILEDLPFALKGIFSDNIDDDPVIELTITYLMFLQLVQQDSFTVTSIETLIEVASR